MFKSILIGIVFLLSINATAEEKDYSNSYEMLDNVLSLGAIMYNQCKKNNYEIVKIDVDLVGKVNNKQVLKHLSSNFTYTVCCVGEPSRIKDIDIKVYFVSTDGKLALVAKDTKTSSVAEAIVEEPADGTYLIDVSVYEMQEGFENASGYFYLTVAHN